MNTLLVLLVGLTLSGNGSPSQPTIRPFTSNDYRRSGITLTSTNYSRLLTAASATTATTSGRSFTTSVAAIYVNDMQFTLHNSGLGYLPPFTWSINPPSAGTINQSGFFTYGAGSGTMSVIATPPPNPFWTTYSGGFSINPTGGATSTQFNGWTTGTLPATFNSEMDNLIAASGTFSTSKTNLLSSIDDTNGVYVRNTALWTGNAAGMTPSTPLSAGSPVDLSGVSVWENGINNYGVKFQATLITPDIMICAAHVPPAGGSLFRFVDNFGTTFTATTVSRDLGAAESGTLSGTTGVGGTVGSVYTDICLVKVSWSGPTPTTLRHYRILPSNYQSYCPDHNLNAFPLLALDQERQIYLQNVTATGVYIADIFGTIESYFHCWCFASPSVYPPYNPNPARVPYAPSVALYSGDSGMPGFVLVKGEPVLLETLTYGSAEGTNPADFQSAINASIAGLGGTGTVGVVDLSSFPTY